MSTRLKVPASGLTTQAAVAPAATSVIPGASVIDPRPGFGPPETRHRVPSAEEVTQAASSPTAIDVTGAGMRERAIGRPVRSWRRTTRPSSPRAHTPAPPAATAIAGTAFEVAVTAPVALSMRTTS